MASRNSLHKNAKSKQKKADEVNESELEINPDCDQIHAQVETISKDIKEMKISLDGMLKKSDIEDLITKTVNSVITSLEKRLKDDIKKQMKEKYETLQDEINHLKFENEQLKDRLKKQEDNLSDLSEEMKSKSKEIEQKTINAIKMGNHNEQYSRKNNIKIMNVSEEPAETNDKLCSKTLTVLAAAGVEIVKEDIMAIHRIPTKGHSIKPIIIKTFKNDVKTKIMRKRKEMKAAGYRIADDVTRLNSELINRLNANDKIHSAWFFNGNVFGRTHFGKRFKFEIFDDVNSVLKS